MFATEYQIHSVLACKLHLINMLFFLSFPRSDKSDMSESMKKQFYYGETTLEKHKWDAA